jgi:hypothetical protein
LRIKVAQENLFFLEAITIQESIISDRLISFLSRPTALNPISKEKNGQFSSLSNLIKQWRKEFPDGLKFCSFLKLLLLRLVRPETYKV